MPAARRRRSCPHLSRRPPPPGGTVAARRGGTTTEQHPTPDDTVVDWFERGLLRDGEREAHELYAEYLAHVRDRRQPPVSRDRFVADLGHLGAREIRQPGAPSFLVRD